MLPPDFAFICCTKDNDMTANPAATKITAKGPKSSGDIGLEYATWRNDNSSKITHDNGTAKVTT